jgi:hypothetical protein
MKRGGTLPSHDVIAWARERGYAIRNLHDGGPVPPAQAQPLRRSACRGEESWDAIVGRNGYVAPDGDRLAVYGHWSDASQARTGRDSLLRVGVSLNQIGETDAGGSAPVACLPAILAILRVSRLVKKPV